MSEPKHTNRLAQEKSPYLLQHAHNPVDWYPWGPEAFEKAKAEDKAIFLSIGYATCHWCHVMERESFENEEIAKIMNEHFINIKVDREERPDVDQIYMTAVQAMTGGGGWPLSAFLTPERTPFYGGTYFPPDRRYGRPGFPEILEEIARVWREERDRVIGTSKQLTEVIEQNLTNQPGELLDEAVLKKFYQHTSHSFDAEYGGFGPAPKFPRSEQISILLRIHRRTGEKRALEMATRTLDAMARGGIYDHLGGGFARYATDQRWLIPHFEKMLYDNALLTRSYLEAYQVTHNEDWASIAKETLDYVLRDMTAESGGFFSAEDADSEDEEGKFYTWSEPELKTVLTEAELKEFKQLFPLSLASILDGKFVLHLDPKAPWQERYTQGNKGILQKLFEQRARRIRPLLDDKILASWNGLMISAMAQAAGILQEVRYLAAAQNAMHFIIDNFWDGEILKRRYRAGEVRYNGSLDDYACIIAALLDLYAADFDSQWFTLAVNLQKSVDRLFWDASASGYYYTDATDNSLITRTKELYDGAMPSGNSITAMNLIRLYHYTLDERYLQRFHEVIRAVSGRLKDNPLIAPALLLAIDFATDEPAEIVIAGMKDDPCVQETLNDLAQSFLPNKVVALADSMDPERLQQMPLIEGKVPQNNRATIYICKNHSCQKPVHEWPKAKKSLTPSKYDIS